MQNKEPLPEIKTHFYETEKLPDDHKRRYDAID
jgi:hypothetical protein